METIRYPESDAEAIDKALAKHEDRKAALQIQRDILHSSKNSIFAGQSNGGEDSSSESSSDEDDGKNVEVTYSADQGFGQAWTRLNMVMGVGFRLVPIFATALAALNKTTCLKSGS